MKTIGTGRESSLEDDDIVVVPLEVSWCEGMKNSLKNIYRIGLNFSQGFEIYIMGLCAL